MVESLRPASSGSVQLPGPYPRTPEERAAAAKKYNIRLEDYEPYPDDGMGYGDYPKLPDKSQEERNPYYDWDHPDLRRNYGEPVHWDFDMYLRHRVDTSPTILSFDTMQYWLFGFIALLLALTFLGELFPYYQPMAPKQYPFDHENQKIGEKPKRLKHYEI
ncbi:hypothetical protein JRQ81_017480 [Phrynocephalus forsythii]|uniref:NADH dehydrogenase [ubiquinone] 1 beta subcomplex subunit 8, mitochondrial n=1 Tax=Phrynocephalus forsythii TaxID=171643 RepID=A0A9Q1B0J0_9SAUR|nr:hypothetical protein JRQ81_017480 [Phrynocephalus forsythii]